MGRLALHGERKVGASVQGRPIGKGARRSTLCEDVSAQRACDARRLSECVVHDQAGFGERQPGRSIAGGDFRRNETFGRGRVEEEQGRKFGTCGSRRSRESRAGFSRQPAARRGRIAKAGDRKACRGEPRWSFGRGIGFHPRRHVRRGADEHGLGATGRKWRFGPGAGLWRRGGVAQESERRADTCGPDRAIGKCAVGLGAPGQEFGGCRPRHRCCLRGRGAPDPELGGGPDHGCWYGGRGIREPWLGGGGPDRGSCYRGGGARGPELGRDGPDHGNNYRGRGARGPELGRRGPDHGNYYRGRGA
mmetsp:Transcript_93391/g.263624  ORF Transcript_93391/g.263624 Transcript_93391/m.263624 type:complete len:305 (+) Transcript_93391:757-1671(+)